MADERSNTKNILLKTLAFADAVDTPLTAYEVWVWLLEEASAEQRRTGRGTTQKTSLFEVMRVLVELVGEKILVEQDGYYAFADRGELVRDRLERLQINTEKLKRAGQWARWMVRLPYVRGVFAYGSLATGNTKEESDLDVLIVVAPGHIFTARFFMTWFTEMFGIRRAHALVKDRICLNHYVTEDALAVPEAYRNLPTAWLWARMFLLAGHDSLAAERFVVANAWIGEWLPNYHEMTQNLTQKDAKIVGAVSRKVSRGSAKRPGDLFEGIVRWLQLRKIARNPLTKISTGRIVANDNMLIFHPDLPEERRMRAYAERLVLLGIVK